MQLSETLFGGRRLIVGIGSALVDMLAEESDAFVEESGGAKGGMIPAEKEFIERTLSRIPTPPAIVPGGSACNTIIGIGNLGGPARFIGKCGQDDLGNLIRDDLIGNGVEPVLFTSPAPTGRVLTIITPDAQRTMFTFLGAASETSPEEISMSCFERAAIVHIEGYLLHNVDLMRAVLSMAKEAGACVSLDLASYTIVRDSRDYLEEMVAEYVDILIANEDEARVFTGHEDEAEAVAILSERASLSVLKVGERGSYVSHDGKIERIQPVGSGSAIDTTGAGDLWASGFLFGLVNGHTPRECGELGSACGYEVCQVIGAAIPDEGWQRIKGRLAGFPGAPHARSSTR